MIAIAHSIYSWCIRLVNVAEISETMRTMAREMERVSFALFSLTILIVCKQTGLVDEIIGDAMDSMDVSF